MAVAMISIIGTLIVLMLTFLIAQLNGTNKKVDSITERLSKMVAWTDYTIDRDKFIIRLDDQGLRIAKIEFIIDPDRRQK